jgi:hypothetical protein
MSQNHMWAATKIMLTMLLMAGAMWAQTASGATQFATILPDYYGRILAYSFPATPWINWNASGHQKKLKLTGTNVLQLQTVDGVTYVYLRDTHDICGKDTGYCYYLGVLSAPLEVDSVDVESAVRQHVTGTFYGTFTDSHGNTYQNVLGLLSLDTFPATDTIQVGSVGHLDVIFNFN